MMDLQIITENKPRHSSFREELERIKIRFLYDASPIEISEAIDDGILTQTEFENLYEIVKNIRDKGIMASKPYTTMQCRVAINEPGDYNICMFDTLDGQQLKVMRVR